MKFSQRIGKTQVTKLLQIETIDEELKNGLWNAVKIYILDKLSKHDSFGNPTDFEIFCSSLWHYHYKLPIDTISTFYKTSEKFIRDRFYDGEWYEIYDLLEFISNLRGEDLGLEIEEFKEFCNEIFEREFSGYRFIERIICPITNEIEMDEIVTAIDGSGRFTSLKGVNIHLKSALEKLSDKKNPDYRNSIKESISAIESVAKVISGNTKDTLGGALDKIRSKIQLHTSLEKGFKQIYGYTSDNGGIRHALMDETNCDFIDAKYMAVSCSAFINYLIQKAEKAGINLQ